MLHNQRQCPNVFHLIVLGEIEMLLLDCYSSTLPPEIGKETGAEVAAVGFRIVMSGQSRLIPSDAALECVPSVHV